ncbi:hypothetical protein B0H11DRAFT_781390 [Mycena galericulata]|nr:hypothetical protein B0H11DRAFT_781390 [Mycena galericulata]
MLPVRDIGPGLDGDDIYALKILFLEITAAALSYGLFLCIGIISIYTLLRKGLRGQRARQAVFAIILTMLVAATAHLGLYVGWIVVQLPSLGAEYVDRTMLLKRLSITQTWLRRFTYFLSDVIVVWRAWVIWQNNRLVHAGLAICILATGVTSLTLAVFNTKSQFEGARYTRNTQNFLGTFGLLFTNAVCTLLISWKLWYYRRNIKKYINRPGGDSTKVESILILLMETGGLYCVFWILLMIGDYGYYGPDFGFEWFQPNISGIYPTIIVFMVSRQMMVSEEVLTATHPTLSSSRTDRTIYFAPSPFARTTVGGESDDASVILTSLSQK